MGDHGSNEVRLSLALLFTGPTVHQFIEKVGLISPDLLSEIKTAVKAVIDADKPSFRLIQGSGNVPFQDAVPGAVVAIQSVGDFLGFKGTPTSHKRM